MPGAGSSGGAPWGRGETKRERPGEGSRAGPGRSDALGGRGTGPRATILRVPAPAALDLSGLPLTWVFPSRISRRRSRLPAAERGAARFLHMIEMRVRGKEHAAPRCAAPRRPAGRAGLPPLSVGAADPGAGRFADGFSCLKKRSVTHRRLFPGRHGRAGAGACSGWSAAASRACGCFGDRVKWRAGSSAGTSGSVHPLASAAALVVGRCHLRPSLVHSGRETWAQLKPVPLAAVRPTSWARQRWAPITVEELAW